MGTPTEATWEGVTSLPNYDTRSLNDYPAMVWRDVSSLFTALPYVESLLGALLQVCRTSLMSLLAAASMRYVADESRQADERSSGNGSSVLLRPPASSAYTTAQ